MHDAVGAGRRSILTQLNVHCCCAKVQVKGGKTITLGVWDTAGAEQFESLGRMYYRCGAPGALCACLCVSFQKKCGASSSAALALANAASGSTQGDLLNVPCP